MVDITTPSPKTINIARGPMAGKGATVMKNVAKNTINKLAKEARNLNLTHSEQMIVVKVMKAIYAGDNALAFALLVANEKLFPLVYTWGGVTANGGVR